MTEIILGILFILSIFIFIWICKTSLEPYIDIHDLITEFIENTYDEVKEVKEVKEEVVEEKCDTVDKYEVGIINAT